MRESNIGGELKEMAQEVVRFGERCVQAGRDWLNERREDMNNRDNEGRRDYRSGKGHEQGRGERETRYGESRQNRGAQYREEDPYSTSRQQSQGYGRSSGEYYAGHQFDERSQSGSGDDDRSSWEYEGGPERYSAIGEAGQSYRRGQSSSPRRDTEYGGQRERGTYGAGTGDYYRGREYGAHGQRYGEASEYTRSQQDYERGMRGSRSVYGTTSVYGGESAGSGGRSSLYGGQDYQDEGEMSGYRGREQPLQYGAGAGKYGTAPGQLGYGGYRAGYRSYRGVGPKNYTRSDERISEEINERLTDDDDLDASEITVRVIEGKVTLEGSVDQRWMKHRAEDIADSCNGVKEVDNRIQVTATVGELGRQDRDIGKGTARTTTPPTTGAGGTTPH